VNAHEVKAGMKCDSGLGCVLHHRNFLQSLQLITMLCRYGSHGGKVTRHVSFSERLDLRPYMSDVKSPSSVWYSLYAVLVHNGCSINSGHYYCYVRAPGGTWHCMNDSSVSSRHEMFSLIDCFHKEHVCSGVCY